MKLSVYNEKNELIHTSYHNTIDKAISKAQNWITKRKVKSILLRASEYKVKITYNNFMVYKWNYIPTFR